MASEGAHPSGIDAFRPDPRPGIPTQVQASFRLWLLAVAAGLFETALVVIDAADGEVGSAAEVAVGVAVRLLVFAGLVYLAAQLHQGHNWARVALAVLYGGIGTLSLVIGPVTWLVEGGSLGDAVAAADLGSLLFAASRVVHLGAVIAALVLMFHPAASAYLRATTRAPARRRTRQDRLSPGCWSIAAGSVLALRPCWPFARSGGSGIPRGVHNGDVACELPARADRGSVG